MYAGLTLYRCRCHCEILGASAYSLRTLDHAAASASKTVGRRPKPHRPAHVRLGDLGHEDDDWVLGFGIKLGRGAVWGHVGWLSGRKGRKGEVRTREAADVACPFAHCELEAKADDLLLACRFDGEHRGLHTADAKATWYEDTAANDVSGEISLA